MTQNEIKRLKEKRLFLLDMDGTIYLDHTLFDGTLDFLNYVKSVGGRYLFLTNNSSKGVNAYIEKLKGMGIDATAEDFLTSTDATIPDLKQNHGNEKIYAMGTKSFCQQLKDSGLHITTRLEEDITTLVISNDTELTFQKLEDASILLGRGVDYIATNPDWVCPTWYGFVPDCGSFAEMLFRATGRRPRFIGKPQPQMLYFAMEKTGYSPEATLMIGDRIYTDIASGIHAGVDAMLVMSGETTDADLDASEQKPTFVLEHIRALHTLLTQ